MVYDEDCDDDDNDDGRTLIIYKAIHGHVDDL